MDEVVSENDDIIIIIRYGGVECVVAGEYKICCWVRCVYIN